MQVPVSARLFSDPELVDELQMKRYLEELTLLTYGISVVIDGQYIAINLLTDMETDRGFYELDQQIVRRMFDIYQELDRLTYKDKLRMEEIPMMQRVVEAVGFSEQAASAMRGPWRHESVILGDLGKSLLCEVVDGLATFRMRRNAEWCPLFAVERPVIKVRTLEKILLQQWSGWMSRGRGGERKRLKIK